MRVEVTTAHARRQAGPAPDLFVRGFSTLAPLVVALVSLLSGSAHALSIDDARATGSASTNRVAIVVGNNVGLVDEEILRYAEDDAEKIRRSLIDLAGYAQDDVHLLQGARADDLRTLLGRLSTVSSTTTLFFYYSGHGDDTNLHLRGTRLPLREIRMALDAIASDVQIVLVDSCRSGALIRPKGATLGPAFDVDVRRTSDVRGRIIITSSSASEVAQESDRLRGSFFTHYWVSGLYGRADTNDDGLITLEEAYRFAHYQTVTETQASSGGVQHPSYDLEVAGEGSVVLANLKQSGSALSITSASEGSYLVFDADNRLLLTEVAVAGPGDAVVLLPAGRYQVTKREDARLLSSEVSIVDGRVTALKDAEMREASIVGGGEKGAADLSLREEVGRALSVERHGPTVRVGARAYLVEGFAPGAELLAGYRLAWRFGPVDPFVEPRVALRSSATLGASPAVLVEGDVGSALGIMAPFGPFSFGGGVDGGVAPFMTANLPTAFAAPGGILPLTVQGRGFAEAGLAVADGVHIDARAFGGGQLYSLRGIPVVFPTAGATIGATIAF
jgi:hypothetical protein